jgi:predicted lipid-binding transport protein (Tim44 family)
LRACCGAGGSAAVNPHSPAGLLCGRCPRFPASGSDEVGLTPDDFNEFERVLGEVQTSYSREDVAALRAIATPEVASYFAEDLAANASKGVVNRVTDVKLLQGDLAEAWREGETEYATVAMRYSLVDEMLDRASGHVVSGGPDEATEIWTFMRQRGGRWLLSAIQQK